MKAIDKEISEKALNMAQDAVLSAKNEKEEKLIEKEQSMNDLINELAKQLIIENSEYMPEDVAKIVWNRAFNKMANS